MSDNKKKLKIDVVGAGYVGLSNAILLSQHYVVTKQYEYGIMGTRGQVYDRFTPKFMISYPGK